MKVHGNAALGPAGRLALVQAIEELLADYPCLEREDVLAALE